MNTNGIATTIAADVESYISPSRLKLWLKCPLAFKLRYIDGVVSPSNANLLLGRVVHSGLERFYRYRERGIRLYPEIVGDSMRMGWQSAVDDAALEFATHEEERALLSQAVKLVQTYLDTEDVAKEAPPLAVERRLEAPLVDPFTGEDLGMPLVGIIDLVASDKEGPVVVDFKTAARSSGTAVDIIHEVQLSCYSWLFRHATGMSEGGLEIRSLIKTKTPKIETHRFGPRGEAHYRRLFNVIRAYLDAIEKMRFHARPGFECGWCEHRETVCSW